MLNHYLMVCLTVADPPLPNGLAVCFDDVNRQPSNGKRQRFIPLSSFSENFDSQLKSSLALETHSNCWVTWVGVSGIRNSIPPSSNHNSSNNSSSSNHVHLGNGTSTTTNGSNGSTSASHILLYKWTPISQSNKENNCNNRNNSTAGAASNDGKKISGKDENGGPAAALATEEPPPKRKFKYIPIAVLEEQKREEEENTEDEAKAVDDEASSQEPPSHYENNADGEKPDINDIPMEESQVVGQRNMISGRQDLNESTLDLRLGLTSGEGEQQDPESKSGVNHDAEGR